MKLLIALIPAWIVFSLGISTLFCYLEGWHTWREQFRFTLVTTAVIGLFGLAMSAALKYGGLL